MTHVFIEPDAITDGRAVIRGEDARHLTTVLRAAPGMPLTLADGSGVIYRGRVTRVGEDVDVETTGATEVPRHAPAIRVVHALPKGRKLDEVVQRLTELGVDRVTPVHSARSQVRLVDAKANKAHRRWSAVAHAAARQSRRARLPLVDEVGDWAAHDWSSPGVVLWEEASVPLRSVVADRLPGQAPTLTVAVGPEGGLTDEEVRCSGLPVASLGPTTLRTEFASVAGVVAVMTLLGRFG